MASVNEESELDRTEKLAAAKKKVTLLKVETNFLAIFKRFLQYAKWFFFIYFYS